MLYPNTVNKEQIRRWSSEDGLFSKLLNNQFMLNKSILSRYWISETSKKDASRLILEVIDREFDKTEDISIIHYAPSLHYAKLADDETNKYQLVKIDGEYYLKHSEIETAEMFKLQECFNIIIDEVQCSPVILFNAVTTQAGAGGLIGFVLTNVYIPKTANLISGMLQIIRMSSIDHTRTHIFELDPSLEKIFKELDEKYGDQEDYEEYPDSTMALFIACGLNNPVTDDYYKKQLQEVAMLYLQENKKEV